MRKVFSLLLVLVICLGMCTCGNSAEEVKENLVDGSWVQESTQDDGSSRRTYTFSYDGTFHDFFRRLDVTVNINRTGTYVIKSDKIILCYNDHPSDEYIYYTYTNGQLVLYREVNGEKIPLNHE